MKRTPFLFCLLWSLSLCLSACSDDDGLVYPPNVADAIPDGEFRVLCLQLADTDLNGVISKEEALAVRKIDCTPDPSYVKAISSLEGLHYFCQPRNAVLRRSTAHIDRSVGKSPFAPSRLLLRFARRTRCEQLFGIRDAEPVPAAGWSGCCCLARGDVDCARSQR